LNLNLSYSPQRIDWLGVSIGVGFVVGFGFEMGCDNDLILWEKGNDSVFDRVRACMGFRKTQVVGEVEMVFDPHLIVDPAVPHLMVASNGSL
jgi:hypothetical protein